MITTHNAQHTLQKLVATASTFDDLHWLDYREPERFTIWETLAEFRNEITKPTVAGDLLYIIVTEDNPAVRLLAVAGLRLVSGEIFDIACRLVQRTAGESMATALVRWSAAICLGLLDDQRALPVLEKQRSREFNSDVLSALDWAVKRRLKG